MKVTPSAILAASLGPLATASILSDTSASAFSSLSAGGCILVLKSAVKKRVSTDQIGRAYETLSGNSETRLKHLMDNTGLDATKLIRTLEVYKSRQWSRQEFPSYASAGEGREPARDKETVLTALNKVGSIVQAAKLLKTTPITLSRWIGHYRLKQIIEYGGDKKITWK